MDDLGPTRTLRFALVLTFGSGFMDAYTYLARGGTFAITQTGNMVLFAVDAAGRHWTPAMAHAWPIPAFMLGIAVAARIEAGHARLPHPLRWAVGAQIVALTAIGFLPATAAHEYVTIPVAFLGAVQIGLFRNIGELTYMPAATTGNLMRFVQQAYDAYTRRGTGSWQAVRIYGALIVSFAGGAVVGAFATQAWEARASWVAACLAALMLAMLIVDPVKS
ncbi:MAG: YoaK family protein [Mycobacterium sp.]